MLEKLFYQSSIASAAGIILFSGKLLGFKTPSPFVFIFCIFLYNN